MIIYFIHQLDLKDLLMTINWVGKHGAESRLVFFIDTWLEVKVKACCPQINVVKVSVLGYLRSRSTCCSQVKMRLKLFWNIRNNFCHNIFSSVYTRIFYRIFSPVRRIILAVCSSFLEMNFVKGSHSMAWEVSWESWNKKSFNTVQLLWHLQLSLWEFFMG